MPIKNLDGDLFADKSSSQTPPSKGLNFGDLNLNINPNEDMYKQMGSFMESLPEDVMDKLNDLSKELAEQLKDVDFSQIMPGANFNIARLEVRNPLLQKLMLLAGQFEERKLELDGELKTKVEDLIAALNNRLNPSSDQESYDALLNTIKKQNDKPFSIVVEEFNSDEFISFFGFKEDGKYLSLTNIENLKLYNPIDNLLLDLSKARITYPLDLSKRTNSKLADRALLYLDNTSNYIVLYAYKKDGAYHFYIPKKGNYYLHKIESETSLKMVRQEFFKYKTLPMCICQIESIFVLGKENDFPLLKLGEVSKETFYKQDENLIYVGKYTFNNSTLASDFKAKFDVSSNELPFYVKVRAENINYYLNLLKKVSFNQEIFNNYALKYHYFKNYLYIELS